MFHEEENINKVETMDIENSGRPMIDPCGTPQDKGKGRKVASYRDIDVCVGNISGIQYMYMNSSVLWYKTKVITHML